MLPKSTSTLLPSKWNATLLFLPLFRRFPPISPVFNKFLSFNGKRPSCDMKNFWLSLLFPAIARKSAYGAALQKAECGDAEAQFGLGLRFSVDGHMQDLPKAAEWYRRAASQNHPLAQFNLGIMLSHGQGIKRDDS